MKFTNFNVIWKTDPLFESWLLADPKSKHSFKCKICQCTLDLGNMGRGALVKHNKSAKHIKNAEYFNSPSSRTLLSWTRPVTKGGESPENANSINSAVTGSTSETIIVQNDLASSNLLQNWATTDDVLRAEIYFTLNHSVNHYSFNSSKHSSKLFQTMFPDSKVAKQFACGASKMAYMTTFGLAPYFTDILVNQLHEVHFYSLSFDESYNSILKKEQLDVLVRFYDADREKVVDRYLCSKFLGHTRADNILDSLREAIRGTSGKILLLVKS